MKLVISLELIGDDRYAHRAAIARGQARKPLTLREEIDLLKMAPERERPYVARVIPTVAAPGFRTEELIPLKDYSAANRIGSRGVYAFYTLDDGLYEVNQRLTWGKARLYYLRVADGQKTEMTRQELYQCLRNGR
jgi:hypothetical protein